MLAVTSLYTQEAKTVTAAIKAFTAPAGYEIVPPPRRKTSKVWNYGVRLKNLSTSKHSFACFGSPLCRDNSEKGAYIGISEAALSNALTHIKEKHNSGKHDQKKTRATTAVFSA